MDSKVFDSLLEPVYIINSQLQILYCNEPGAVICDMSVRKMVRAAPILTTLFKFEQKIEALETISQVVDPTPYQEVAYTTEAGGSGKVQITVQTNPATGDAPSWIIFFRDVTLEEKLQRKYRAELGMKEDVIKDLQKAQAELQNYSRNLEQMVADRTAALSRLNQLMSALLDSLGQGFFIFNSEGLCLEIWSKACEVTIECQPSGLPIWQVLKLSDKEQPGFKKWMTTLFGEMLPFEDLAPLGPQTFPHSQGNSIQLQYYPLRKEQGAIEGVVVVATDISQLVAAEKQAAIERSHAKMILSLVQMKRQVQSFIREADELMHNLKTEMAKPSPRGESIFHLLHTMKGGTASFSISDVAKECHTAETILSEWMSSKGTDAEKFKTLQDSTVIIEQLFKNFLSESEQIIGSAQKNEQRWIEIPVSRVADFSTQLKGPVYDQFVEVFLMEEIETHFRYFDHVIAAVKEQLGKQVMPIHFRNGGLKFIPEHYEHLLSTLIHAFRNAVDHGIEAPDVRLAANKTEAGSIYVEFSLKQKDEAPFLHIQIRDDGGGIDPQKIRDKLAKKGVDTANETDAQVIQHIFDSQFSTKEVITETSGRGVGLDAIQMACRELGGTCHVKSKVGKGSQLNIEVPYIKTFDLRKRALKAA